MELDQIKSYFTPTNILDIGANVGGWYNHCKSYFPDSYILSIEANEGCESALKACNPNYIIALLAKDEEMYDFFTLRDAPTATGNSIYKELTYVYTDNSTIINKKKGVMLDNLLRSRSFDLIKMDVQGAELDVIKGGITICKQAKGIILEVAFEAYNQNAPLYDEVIEYMSSIGFSKELILTNLPQHHDIFFINKNIL
jgi:FkbM family methyltransferase